MIPSIAFAHSFKLYVGNADGTCAIQLAKLAQQCRMAFTFTGTKYRVFWAADTGDEVKLISRMRWTVKMVEFTVGPNGGIVETLPLPVRELYRDAVTTSNSSVALQFGRAGDNRIYVKQNLSGGEQVLEFYEDVVGSGWQGRRVVASTTDAFYAARGVVSFGGVSFARQDWENDGSVDDLLAVPWNQRINTALRVDVLNREPGCTVSGTGGCLSNRTASVVAPGLTAYVHYYGIDWKPDGSLLRVDSATGTPVIESFDPHSGTSATLVTHGPGILPAGLKQ